MKLTPSVYDFTDYRKFLKEIIFNGHRAKRGSLSALANAIPCQVSYVSRVMSERAEFSLEQADKVSQHLGLTGEETYYFLMLVEWARAGTDSLRHQFQKRIDQEREKRLNLKERVGVRHSLKPADQATYYSAWYYSAVHVMSGIESLQTKEAMAKQLGMPINRISEILDFLSSVGLVEKKKDGKIKTGIGKIHLERDSPMVIRHHGNWRFQAIRSMERAVGDGVHYSVLINVSKEDAKRLRTKITQFIEDFMKVVHPSRDEITYGFNLDFFNP